MYRIKYGYLTRVNKETITDAYIDFRYKKEAVEYMEYALLPYAECTTSFYYDDCDGPLVYACLYRVNKKTNKEVVIKKYL